MMQYRPFRQQGMTAISFLVLFTLVGFFCLILLKLTPIYLEHYKIQSTLNTLKSEPALVSKTPREIIDMLQKRWDINSIDRIKADKSVFIERRPGGILKIEVAYEVEEPILGNLSVLVKFDDAIESGDSN